MEKAFLLLGLRSLLVLGLLIFGLGGLEVSGILKVSDVSDIEATSSDVFFTGYSRVIYE
ncbi:1973_t:CDS:2 [Dentiscutata heterogama]|uniref:1973_t:CDS:1 n=1 Tax=Dentiscutata heterogama TaxID=1316150 RepID=A0ACA9LNN0_9GLOM|nr:1973_t:CDS:2 [Dentiscutata heterogama]